uniref:Uncharacterized protein n=1 Tax=Arundo donax TaxID=35708 RepID=A0A0A8YMI9_ARUDO
MPRNRNFLNVGIFS